MNAKTLPLQPALRLSTLLSRVAEWMRASAARRASRRRRGLDHRLLAEMNDRALSDLGIGRDQIARLTTGFGPATER